MDINAAVELIFNEGGKLWRVRSEYQQLFGGIDVMFPRKVISAEAADFIRQLDPAGEHTHLLSYQDAFILWRKQDWMESVSRTMSTRAKMDSIREDLANRDRQIQRLQRIAVNLSNATGMKPEVSYTMLRAAYDQGEDHLKARVKLIEEALNISIYEAVN